ncbi:hypothetical protein [Photobacterium leiognathi]|nr:hypothetical protein [Photobacterium leiognathi]
MFLQYDLLTVTTGMFITGFIALFGFPLVIKARKEEAQDAELQTA